MSIRVEFPQQKSTEIAKGTAGLQTHMGGCCTTVSALSVAGNRGLIKKSLG